MNRLVRNARLSGNCFVFVVGKRSSDGLACLLVGHEVFKADGEADRAAEFNNFIEFFFGAVFQNELANGTESNYFAVEVAAVNVVDAGKTVMQSVSCGKTARFKSETGKKNVGFDYFFKSGSDCIAIASGFCFSAVGNKAFIAKGCESESGVSAVSEQSAFCSVRAAGETCVYV